MSDVLKFRECTLDDAWLIADIYNESIKAGNASMEDELKTPRYIEQWLHKFNDREQIVILENGLFNQFSNMNDAVNIRIDFQA